MNDAVIVMNRAFAADPDAIHALMVNRVPCNMDLADDPTVMVEHGMPGHCPVVGALGLVNGVLGQMGLPLVVALFSDLPDPVDGRHTLLGFQEYRTQ